MGASSFWAEEYSLVRASCQGKLIYFWYKNEALHLKEVGYLLGNNVFNLAV